MDRLLFIVEENSDKLVCERFMETNIIVNVRSNMFYLINRNNYLQYFYILIKFCSLN